MLYNELVQKALILHVYTALIKLECAEGGGLGNMFANPPPSSLLACYMGKSRNLA